MSDVFHVKYRPKTFAEVIGHGPAVKSLQRIIDRYESQAFLFTGPAGTGKTTLARICSDMVGCEPSDLVEIDGATFTGVDEMRKVQQMLQYRPFGKSEARAIILDEAHRLSKNAWDSLLKVTEEPPAHVYWFLCTTDVAKIPTTIKTRFTHVPLKPLSDADVGSIIDRVVLAEKLKLNEGVRDLVIKESRGSGRQALGHLAMVYECASKKEAAAILESAIDSDPVRELCQFLLKGGSWAKAMAIVAKLEDESAESVRIVVMNYMAAVAKGAKTDREAGATLQIMDAFCVPYNQSEKLGPLMLSIGRVLFNG